jgi:selenium-binding protein 1
MSATQDPTFYRTPAEAIAAPPERLAYVAAYDPAGRVRDAMTVLDTDPSSPRYGQIVGWSELPTAGNELHHFGWNACSSALCHQGHGNNGAPLERRYLIVPGLRSSRTYVLDTKPDPRNPRVVRTIEADELARKAGYSRPHTLHCGPEAIFMSALGGANGDEGPAGIALLDHDTFEVIGAWEADRGDQFLGYDVWWHLNHDTLITSEWGSPSMIENGLNPDDLLGRKFGHHLNFWSMSERKLTQRIDLGDANQMVLELRPAHDPSKTWGFSGVTINVEDLSASVWLWYRDGDRWAARKVITIPAEPADPAVLPPALQPFGAVPPLITDIDLTVDDRWLYVSCWGTGELKQYDVTDLFHPRETASIRLGGIVTRQPHPAAPGQPLGGGPQMVELSRDGKRVYVTNSLYAAWDEVFLPRRGRCLAGQTRCEHRGRRPGRRRAFLPPRLRVPRAAGAPDPAGRRRRIQRLLLLHRVTATARILGVVNDERVVRPGAGRRRADGRGHCGRGVSGPAPEGEPGGLVRGRRGRAAHYRGIPPAPRRLVRRYGRGDLARRRAHHGGRRVHCRRPRHSPWLRVPAARGACQRRGHGGGAGGPPLP